MIDGRGRLFTRVFPVRVSGRIFPSAKQPLVHPPYSRRPISFETAFHRRMKTPASGPGTYLSSFAILFGFVGLALTGGELVMKTMGLPLPVSVVGAAVSAALMVWGARGMARADRELREWVAGDHPLARQQLAEKIGAVLANWSYAPDEWAAYVAREREAQKRDGRIFMTVMAPVVGMAGFANGIPLWAAALITVGTWIVGVLAYPRSMGMTRQLEPGDVPPSATLASNAVIFHGRRLYLRDDDSHIRRVRYVEGDAPHLLVIIHTSVGHGRSEIRIPVPRGREEEARLVAAHFPRRVPAAAPVG
jgi:hypothetical protein